MKMRKLAMLATCALALLLVTGVQRSYAQEAANDPSGKHVITLWTDPRTGEVFTRPGKGRVRLAVVPAGALEGELDKHVEEKAKDAARAEVSRSQEELRAEFKREQEQSRAATTAMAQEVQAMQPAWHEFGDRWFKKIKLSTLIYGDYAFYSHTGFGPQFLTQINPPGPGNNAYNSFDISRTYLNFLFSPTDEWTARITPNIYREVGNVTAASSGRVGAIGSSLNGNLGFRLKYAYLDYNKALTWAGDSFKEGKLTIGQLPNPLVGWEEDLYGYRWVNLTPWNYLSLSSTQTGMALHGPIKFGERQYVDYDFGVYTNASFHALEQTNTKQTMARVTLYPFGARSRFDGLGLTGFYDYGYANNTPDNTGAYSAAKNGHVTRMAALVHYTSETWGLGAEFDAGHNAFTSGNLFSGAGPADEFLTLAKPTVFGPFDSLVKALQNNGASHQEGFDFFGHVQIPNTPFTLFGMFEQFLPNTKVDVNPVDFQRVVAGIEYKYNKYLRFALDSQNLLYYHSDFTFPASDLANFNPKLAKANPAGIKYAVPRDIHAIFLNVEFSY